MDVGGVWNGSSDVTATTGDTFRASYTNSGDSTAFELDIGVTLPTGFTYVTGSLNPTWSGAGCPLPGSRPTITANQSGTNLDFSFLPAGFDLPADCTLNIDYGLTVNLGVAGGTYVIHRLHAFASSDGGVVGATADSPANILVKQGDSTAEISPVRQTIIPGENGNFKALICNTGFGGNFDVQLNLNYSGLSFVSAIQNTTDLGASTVPMSGTNPSFLVPYLAPDKCFVLDIVATVNSCGATSLEVSTDNRNHTSIASFTGNVDISPKAPLLTYSPMTLNVPGNGTAQNFTMLITNNGLGVASNVSFDTSYESTSLTITNLSPGWSYNSGTGVFSFSGSLAAGASTTLSFDASKTLSCAARNASNTPVIWYPLYTDACGNNLIPPTTIQTVTIAAVSDPFNITKTTPLLRPVAGSTQTWTINYQAGEVGLLTGSGQVVITDTLPSNVQSISNLNESAGVLSCSPNCTNPAPGSTVTWTLSPTEAQSNQTLEIDYVIPDDAPLSCVSGNPITNTVSSTMEYLELGCQFTDTDSSTNYINNSSGVTGSAAYFVGGSISGIYQTGVDADADHSNYTAALPDMNEGEGSFLNFENTLNLSSGDLGTWAGSVYRDNFGGLTSQQLVPLNNGEFAIEYRLNGGSWTQVPAANLISTSGQLEVNLSFIDGGSSVTNDELALRYKTTVNDSDLALAVRRSVVSLSTWDINSNGTGCSGDYISPLLYNIARRASDLSVSMPSAVEVCGTTPVTIGVSAAELSFGGLPGWNPLLQLNNGSYRILGFDSYSGVFNAGNILSNPGSIIGASNPEFTYGPTPIAQAGAGSFTVDMALQAGATGLPGVMVSGSYDDTETAQGVTRSFALNSSTASPLVLKKANLVITVSPNPTTVYLDEGYFSVYVLNSGDGTATDVVVEDTLPAGLSPNAATSDPAPVIAGQKLTFNLGSMAPGELREVKVGYTVAGGTCSIPNGSNNVRVTWGCFGTEHEVETSTQPNFVFPTGKVNVLHDSSSTNLEMCGPLLSNFIEVVVKNTGITLVKNAEVIEDLDLPAGGMTMVPGSVSIKTYSGTTLLNSTAENPAYDPENILTGIPNYKWTSTQIPELGALYPLNSPGVGPGGPITEVRIRYRVDVSDNANSNPTITSSVSGETSCGNTFTSPGLLFSAPIKKPDITVSKVGRRGVSGSFGETVYAGINDTVQWQVSVSNTGQYSANNLRLTENLPNSPGAPTMNISCTDGTSLVGVADLSEVNLNTLAAGSTTTCTVTQNLGASCIDQNNVASVQWGCTGSSALTTPTKNSDTAFLQMSSDFASSNSVVQAWNDLPGGRAQVVLTLNNNQAPIRNLNVTNDLPGGYEYDESSPVVIGGDAALTLTTSPVGGETSPIFKFEQVGEVFENAKVLTITFYVIPNSGFDTTQDPLINPETTANSLDPVSLPSGGDTNNVVTLNYEDSCGNPITANDTVAIDPKTPDLDISVTPQNQVVANNTDYCFDFTVVNNGESGSTANNVTFDITLGSGWADHTTQPRLQVLNSQGAGATLGTCGTASVPATCTASQIGNLTAGQNAVLRSCVKSTTGGSLTVLGAIRGNLFDAGGVDTGNDYSYDTARSRSVGITIAKTVVSTSEAWTSCVGGGAEPCAANTYLAIGEDITHRLSISWFGLDTSEASSITSINLRDAIPAGMGYVSHTTTGSHNAAFTMSPASPTLGQTGNFNFSLTDIPFSSGGGTFEVDMVTRMLNNSANRSVALPHTKTNTLHSSFIMLGNKFCSANLSGGCSTVLPALQSARTVNLQRPSVTFNKEVRTLAGSFSDNINAVGGDELEYRVRIANASGANGAPLFDIAVNDTLNGKLKLVNLSLDTIDNDSDSTVDALDVTCSTPPCEGHSVLNAVGVSDTLTFNHDNTGKDASAHPAPPASINSLFRLDPGQTLTLLYRGNVDISANPTEVLANNAGFVGDTLPGASGSQVVIGDSGTSTNAYSISGTDVSNVTINNASLSKSLLSTSLAATTGSNLAIGEQAKFRLTFILPSGTSPAMKVRDVVPAGFRVISRDAPAVGAAISGCTPVTSPALPTNGAVTLLWDFSAGSCVVSAGASSVDRTITFDYTLQVQNISANSIDDTLVNSATFEINSVVSTPQTLTMTLKEPVLTLSKVASPTTGLDAGDEITYTISVSNTGNSPAYDLAFDDLLPAGLEYVASSTAIVTPSSLITTINQADTGTANHLKWGRIASVPQVLDLLAGETFVFEYRVKVLDIAEPGQSLGNSIAMTYTSMSNSNPVLDSALGVAGASDGERDGSDGEGSANNKYAITKTSTVTVDNNYSVLKVASADTLSPNGFRIGDLITYTVTSTLQQGTAKDFKILDTLPSGLEYDSTTSITPGAGVSWTGSPMTPTGTSTRTWAFGDVTVLGTAGVGSGTITLVYVARVKDDSNNAVTSGTLTRSNSARATYDLAGGSEQTTSTSIANISVKQPSLTMVKTKLSPVAATVVAGESVKYRITVTNSGTAPAYNVIIEDTLPVGMRQVSPSTAGSSTLNGNAYSDAITSFNSTTGLATWKLKDSDPVNRINAGSTWVLEYDVVVDTQVGAAQTLSNNARVSEYYSKAESDTVDRRQYVPTSLSSVSVSTPSPGTLSKNLVSPVSGNVAIGQPVQYVIRVPSTPIDAALYDVNILDSLPTQFTSINVSTQLQVANGAVTITDNTSGHNVSVNLSFIPAGNQAIVTIDAILANDLSNNEPQTRSNQASYNWKSSPLGSPTTVGPTPAVNFTIVEPDLTINKTFLSSTMSDSLRGLQTGDFVTYRITVTNPGGENATAYDFNVVDTAEDPLIFDSIVSSNNPGVPSGGTLSAGQRVYTWASGAGDMPDSLAPGESYVFDARFVLGSVQPYQTLTNSSQTDYSSRSGVDANERSYNAIDSTPVDVQTGNVLMSKDLVGVVTNFNVGEEIRYQLRFQPLSGRVNTVRVLDSLPAGLSYRGFTLSQNQVKRAGTVSDPVTVISSPVAPINGASTLTFNLGDVEGTGPAAEIVIEIIVRVDNVGGNIAGTTLKNEAQAKFDNPDSPGSDITLDASNEPTITVSEPELALAVEGPATLTLTQPAQFTSRVLNTGTGKAYQPIVRVDVPTPFNLTDPTTISSLPIAVSISGGRSLTLAPTDYSVTYNAGATGSLIFTFTGANAYVAPGETLNILFPLDVNDDTADEVSASLLATVTNHNSSDVSSAVDDDNRSYSNGFGVGTVGTVSAGLPDDETDDHSITVASPEIIITKQVDKVSYVVASETAPHRLNYTVVLTNNGSAPAYLTEIRDIIDPAYFKAGTLSNVNVVASDSSSGSLAIDVNGGLGSGLITYTGDTIAAASTVTLTYTIELKDYLPNGTLAKNQATAIVDGFTPTFYSDSTNAADDNAINEGNEVSLTDDDPTLTTLVTAPVITHTKTSNDLNGSSLNVGDILEYTIVLNNSGTEHLVNARLKDSIPTNTTYVSGSTLLNGVVVPDVSGVSPLSTLSGMQVEGINGIADGAGWLKVGSTATIKFNVQVSSSASNGTLVINQALLTGQGEGGDTLPTKVSDDPTTGTLDDPTVDIVGTGASLQTQKTVTITQDLDSDNVLDPGEEVEWEITVQNTGVDAAVGVVISDTHPAAPASYVVSSMQVKLAGAGAYTPVSDAADLDEAEINGANLTARFGDIPAGQSASFKFRSLIDGGATLGTIVANQATVTTTNVPTQLSDCDGNPTNGACQTSIPVGATPVLVATKTINDLNGGTVEAGDIVRYTIALSNTGSADIVGLRFRDPGPTQNLGDNLEYVTNSTLVDGVVQPDVSSDMPFKGTFPGVLLGNLAVGSSKIITYDYQIPLTASDGAVFTNQGFANASNLNCSSVATGDPECVTDSTLDDSLDTDGDGLATNDDPTVLSFNGNADKATLEGYVFLDRDHNRTRDVGDPSRSGWGVEVYLCSNPSSRLTTTANPSGFWRVTGITPGGPYCVDFIHPQTGLVFGRANSTIPGVDLTSGSIKGLNLSANTVTSEQNLILDPMGVVYDSVTREPVPGVAVELEYNTGGGWSLVPNNLLLPNQQGQVTGNDGVYEFNLNRVTAPAAEYRIRLNNPSAYIAGISTIIPDDDGIKVINGLNYLDALVPVFGSQLDSMNPPPLTILTAGSIIYHTQFTLNPQGPNYTDPIYNHIAIDPILDDAVIATKRSLKKNIHSGELVPYTLTFKNNLPGGAALSGTQIIDEMPPGFSYVKGSATIDGIAQEPITEGRTLTWNNISYTGAQTKTVKVILLAGLGVKEGVYKNRTWAKHVSSGRTISNVAADDVVVTPDPIFDCPELVGRVYDDKNRNGYWDEGEEGLAGVEVVTARGWKITTDNYGRYHVTCPMIPNSDRGSNFVIKLDTRSLPSGYRVTTENPQVVRLTRGKMSKVNFGASIDQIIRIEVQDTAFKEGSVELNQEWSSKLEKILSSMQGNFRIRIAYVNSAASETLVQERIVNLQKQLKELWKQIRKDEDLMIDEIESFYQKGAQP